jgi:hypothetical protein
LWKDFWEETVIVGQKFKRDCRKHDADGVRKKLCNTVRLEHCGVVDAPPKVVGLQDLASSSLKQGSTGTKASPRY